MYSMRCGDIGILRLEDPCLKPFSGEIVVVGFILSVFQCRFSAQTKRLIT